MSCIVYQENKKTGVKYAYESISYWDKEKQQPRSKRKYIGRVDPDTGKIIRKKEQSSSVETGEPSSEELSRLYEELKSKDEIISELQDSLSACEKKYKALADRVRSVRLSIAEEFADV